MTAEKTKACVSCASTTDSALRRGQCRRCRGRSDRPETIVAAATPAQQLQSDREATKLRSEVAGLKLRYKEALGTIESLESDLGVSRTLAAQTDIYTIQPKVTGQGSNEGTVVLMASDWHSEELVGPEVGGLNRHNPEIAEKRAVAFFRSGLRLTQLLQKDIKIPTMVLPLLGDFITGDIHGQESAELCAEPPMEAIVTVQRRLLSGIEFLLDHSKLDLVIPCHSGNHARQTKTTHFSKENGHSLEYLMYRHMAAYFRTEKRVTFIVPPGPHSYIDIYGKTIRAQHGHMVKFGGGVGGLSIPLQKKIAKWNQARWADYDLLGHFHAQSDFGNAIVNGSQIGYNGFALAIGAAYEPPSQTLFLMDRKRQRKTCLWPIVYKEEAA